MRVISKLACVQVEEAAVIAIPNEKWGERPLLLIVPKPGQEPTEDSILAHLQARPAMLLSLQALCCSVCRGLDSLRCRTRLLYHCSEHARGVCPAAHRAQTRAGARREQHFGPPQGKLCNAAVLGGPVLFSMQRP